MRKDNPAVYECPKGKSKLHYWFWLCVTKKAQCGKCGLVLNEEDAADCFRDYFKNVEVK